MPERSGTPDPPHGAGVGSVADETARLIDALLGSAADAPEPPPPEPEPAAAAGEPCPTCGHADVGEATHRSGQVCHLCPVCQVLRVVRSVRPETLDRLADLAAAVTESLRDAAAERWRTSAATDDARPAPARPRVQDIVVADDDGGMDGTDVTDEPAETQSLEDVR